MRFVRTLLLRLMRRALRLAWRHKLLFVALVAVLSLVLVNGAVRLLGGSPSLFSPMRLVDKTTAIARFVQHVPRHLFGSCSSDRDAQLVAAARRHRVPVALVRAVAEAESGGGSHRVSHAGAMGVMQLMAPTAADLAVVDPFDAEQNIDGGVRYLAWLWRRYDGDAHRVVAAYNAGPGRVPRSGSMRLPGETRRYLTRVLTKDVARACGAPSRLAPRR